MARVKSTALPRDGATDAGGEGAAIESDADSEGHGSRGFAGRTKFVQLSDVGSHSGTGADTNEGSHTCNYHFGPSTVTVSRVREMIDNDYFAMAWLACLGKRPSQSPMLMKLLCSKNSLLLA
jgi:hypothetical protein